MYAKTLDEARYRLTKLWADRKVQERVQLYAPRNEIADEPKSSRTSLRPGVYEQYASPEFHKFKKRRGDHDRSNLDIPPASATIILNSELGRITSITRSFMHGSVCE